MSHSDNIRALLNQVTPDDWAIGWTWYSDVRAWVLFQAKRLGYLPSVVCQVIAALSPRLSWQANLHDARVVLESAGTCCDAFDLPTMAFRRNVQKALDIARGQDVLNGNKVLAFQDNILDPHSKEVTVDVWMVRVAEGNLEIESNGLTDIQYETLASTFRAVADEIGVPAHVLQATLWTTARRIANLGRNNKPLVNRYQQLTLEV